MYGLTDHDYLPSTLPETRKGTATVRLCENAGAANNNDRTNVTKDLEVCGECNKPLLRKNLYNHLRSTHTYSDEQVERVKKTLRLKKSRNFVTCPVCEEKFSDHEGLAGHCLVSHSDYGANGYEQDYTIHSFTFDSMEMFETWLKEKCENTVTSFSRRSMNGSIYYLRCNRAGKYASKSERRSTSSKKAATYCSCFLNVTAKEGGSVQVKGCLGHVGHKVEPALLRITSEQKEYIKSLLEEHSLDCVIRMLKIEFSAETSRLHFITKKDLWNIIYKNGLRVGYCDCDDPISESRSREECCPSQVILGHNSAPLILAKRRLEARESLRDKIEMACAVMLENVNRMFHRILRSLVDIETPRALRMKRNMWKRKGFEIFSTWFQTLDEADFIEYHPQSMTTRTFLGFWYFRRTKMMLSIDLLDPRHPTPAHGVFSGHLYCECEIDVNVQLSGNHIGNEDSTSTNGFNDKSPRCCKRSVVETALKYVYKRSRLH
ncbi:hypothetical protein Q1695_008975 [Nippostrongylus brasiliensis]|nr:hypothetical protein Q1695_008975 [Nippostrongylus brasiliensis]